MSASAHTLYIEGVALWLERLPGWELARAVLRGEAAVPEQAAPRPAPNLLAPTERRRAPDTVAIALEVAARACAAAGRDPATLASVFASTHGDLAISDYLCQTLAEAPTLLSPTKFHNSVHNAAAGYWTIGNHCMAPTTALSAFRHTFASGLLEAVTQVACEGAAVLFVAYDIPARGPMATVTPSRGLVGVALVLSPERSERSSASLSWRTQAGDVAATEVGEPLAGLCAGNPLAPCMSLFEALAHDGPRRVIQSLGPRLALELKTEPIGAALATPAAANAARAGAPV
jgi:hypothetical protein